MLIFLRSLARRRLKTRSMRVQSSAFAVLPATLRPCSFLGSDTVCASTRPSHPRGSGGCHLRPRCPQLETRSCNNRLHSSKHDKNILLMQLALELRLRLVGGHDDHPSKLNPRRPTPARPCLAVSFLHAATGTCACPCRHPGPGFRGSNRTDPHRAARSQRLFRDGKKSWLRSSAQAR